MAAIIQGRKEDYPKRQQKNGKWYFRCNYDVVAETDECLIAETCLMRNDARTAAAQLNDFNASRGDSRVIDEHYFDMPLS